MSRVLGQRRIRRRRGGVRRVLVAGGLAAGLCSWLLAPSPRPAVDVHQQHAVLPAPATAVATTETRPAAGSTESTAPAGTAAPGTAAPGTATPVRLRIPAIGVDTPLQALGLGADGALRSPARWQVAGWYRDGVRPGDPGPAVVVGHVDSTDGPAVFYRLAELRPGELAYVSRADGRTVRFVVDDLARYPKARFPTSAVYGPEPLPVLRLVTCVGRFDGQRHSYVDNLVVSAHLG